VSLEGLRKGEYDAIKTTSLVSACTCHVVQHRQRQVNARWIHARSRPGGEPFVLLPFCRLPPCQGSPVESNAGGILA